MKLGCFLRNYVFGITLKHATISVIANLKPPSPFGFNLFLVFVAALSITSKTNQ